MHGGGIRKSNTSWLAPLKRGILKKNTMKFPNNLSHTRKALKRYFSPLQVSQRQELMDAIQDDITMQHWENAEKEALRKVQMAFFEDTKEINSLDNCLLMDVHTLRKWCEKCENKI